jgi:hypothetical protein
MRNFHSMKSSWSSHYLETKFIQISHTPAKNSAVVVKLRWTANSSRLWDNFTTLWELKNQKKNHKTRRKDKTISDVCIKFKRMKIVAENCLFLMNKNVLFQKKKIFCIKKEERWKKLWKMLSEKIIEMI